MTLERDKCSKYPGRGEVLTLLVTFLFLLIFYPIACRIPQSRNSRTVCARNLSKINRAMLAYANDNEGRFPRSGGSESIYGFVIPNWRGFDRFEAYGVSYDGHGGLGSISSSLYLLVKYYGVDPKYFVCPGEEGATVFSPAEEGAENRKLDELWDFGRDPFSHCSYAYHLPYGPFLLTTSSKPRMAVISDRNPWRYSLMAESKDFNKFDPDGDREAIKAGNSVCHQNEGQNVLFIDGSVSFEDRSFCGVNNDNIYTYQHGGDVRRGGWPTLASGPVNESDSLLIHDPPSYFGPPPTKGRTCFIGDTLVWMDDALVKISEVSQGQIPGKSIHTMPMQWSAYVEQVQEHEGIFECRDIILVNGNRISVVDAHCFMLDSGRWIAAQHLTSGLRLRTYGGTIAIQSVIVRAVPYVGKVYNLKIKNSDMYFVGKDAVIVRDY